MDGGLVPPCLEWDAVLRDVCETAEGLARRRKSRVIRGDWLTVVDLIATRRRLPPKLVSDCLSYLLDRGWMWKRDYEEGFAVSIPVDFFPELAATPGPAGPERVRIAAQPRLLRAIRRPETGASEASDRLDAPRVAEVCPNVGSWKPRHPDNQWVRLCRDYFPGICRVHGITLLPGQMDLGAFVGQVGRWRKDYGLDHETVRQMMDEFVQHRSWCQKSKRSPWRVFISRREELIGLIAQRQRLHPGDRRYRADWMYRGNGHTPQPDWLGRT